MKNRWALFAALPLLAGCASGPGFDSMHAAEPALTANEGRFYFYRPGGLEGCAVQPAIKIDEVKVGDAVPGGYFYVDEPAGTYKISATTETEESVQSSLTPGQSRYIRFDPSFGVLIGHMNPTIVDPEQGSIEIRKCHFSGPSH
jgi:hypothetical protein